MSNRQVDLSGLPYLIPRNVGKCQANKMKRNACMALYRSWLKQLPKSTEGHLSSPLAGASPRLRPRNWKENMNVVSYPFTALAELRRDVATVCRAFDSGRLSEADNGLVRFALQLFRLKNPNCERMAMIAAINSHDQAH
jgi:hypothetical protein